MNTNPIVMLQGEKIGLESCPTEQNMFNRTEHVHHNTTLSTGWRRSIRCRVFTGHFLQKSPMIRGSFAKSDLQLEAS